MLNDKNVLMSGEAQSDELSSIVDVVEKLILRRHDYYSKQDKKYKAVVSCLKVIIAALSLVNTIVLGIRVALPADIQLSIGLVISAVSTFVAGLLAYYNLEKYWIRNVTNHIKLNIMRDSYRCDKADNRLNEERINDYRKLLEEIETDNIKYWNRVVKKNMEMEDM